MRHNRSSVQRLLLDPLWIGATDAELASHTMVPVDVVAETREAFLAFREIANVVTHARAVAHRTGYTGGLWELIDDALEAYQS